MPTITHEGDQWCVEGYEDEAKKCFDSEDEAKKHQAMMQDHEKKEPNEKALFDRIWEQIQERLGRKDADELNTGFKVGGNHWWITWSNNFKDRDQELFSARAIKDYEMRVDMGVTPMPRLWVWHIGKQVDIGQADMVGFDGHFVHAVGTFDTHESAQLAKAYYSKNAHKTGISHGFTFPATGFDGKCYHEFNTFEISLLPRGAEANWYTSLEGVKAMALDEKKQKYLEEVFGKDHAARILADWEKRGKALEELGVEYKDFVDPNPPTETANKAAVEATSKDFAALVPDLMEGSAEAVTAALEAVKLVKAQKDQIAALREELKAVQDELKLRPRASASAETEVKETDLSKDALAAVEQQMTRRDTFWGTTVSTLPNGNS